MKSPLKVILAIVAFTVLAAGGAIARADVIGYWPLDETSGTVAPNLAPGGTDGTLMNGPTWFSDGERGQVLSFDGDDDFVAAGTLPAIAQNDDFTWAFWTFQQQGENNDVIIGNRDAADGSNGTVWVKFTANLFEYRSAPGGDINYPNIPQNQWVHHAVVKTGDTFVYFRDGVDSGLTSTTTGDGAEQPFFIGGGQVRERWQGRIDDVALWDEALSALDIDLIFTSGVGALVNPPGLPGDVNGDDMVDIEDYRIIRDNFNVGRTREEGNLDRQGVTSLADFRIWKNAFEMAPAAVPEPGGLALAVIALTMAMIGRRRAS